MKMRSARILPSRVLAGDGDGGVSSVGDRRLRPCISDAGIPSGVGGCSSWRSLKATSDESESLSGTSSWVELS